MAAKHDAHIRDKAIWLRTTRHLTLDELVDHLKLPKTTIYGWIKDIPIPYTAKQSAAQQRSTDVMRARYAQLRQEAYQQGWDEAPALLRDLSFRDFVVLYMAEGSKRDRNIVEFVNSDAAMVRLANRWITHFTQNKIYYRIQCHIDHDEDALKAYWGEVVGIAAAGIKVMRKSNSGQLSGRQFRSQYGLLSVRVGDTYLRSKLQAWMDYVKGQW